MITMLLLSQPTIVGTTTAERKLVKAFDFKGDATQATAAQVEVLVRARPS